MESVITCNSDSAAVGLTGIELEVINGNGDNSISHCPNEEDIGNNYISVNVSVNISVSLCRPYRTTAFFIVFFEHYKAYFLK